MIRLLRALLRRAIYVDRIDGKPVSAAHAKRYPNSVRKERRP